MMRHAGASIPKACGSWSRTMGAYRLLSNHAVDPHALQTPHREHTRKACATRPVVLAVSDITDLDFTTRVAVSGLGRLGDGHGRGLQQHTTLAVDPEHTGCGGIIGVLRQHWYQRPEAPPGETRRARQARWCEADVWADAAREIGPIAATCRVIHVADRGADIFGFMHVCVRCQTGFLVRAVRDRKVLGTDHRLWEHVGHGPVLDRMEVHVSTQRGSSRQAGRASRTARVAVRAAAVTIPPVGSDPRVRDLQPLRAWAVHVVEERPPRGKEVQPVEWMLLTSEPVTSAQDARRITGWYARRWIVEEFHRVEKEGCRLEATQLDDAADIQRLAAITAVMAVRLLGLRDHADPAHPRADDPRATSELADDGVLAIVSRLCGTPRARLTPRVLLDAIARKGGWLGRAGDGRPGWKCLWRGWHDVALMAQGARLLGAPSG
jgi:Transposase Tn5 dimerisation domain/Transposase DNA-binding